MPELGPYAGENFEHELKREAGEVGGGIQKASTELQAGAKEMADIAQKSAPGKAVKNALGALEIIPEALGTIAVGNMVSRKPGDGV